MSTHPAQAARMQVAGAGLSQRKGKRRHQAQTARRQHSMRSVARGCPARKRCAAGVANTCTRFAPCFLRPARRARRCSAREWLDYRVCSCYEIARSSGAALEEKGGFLDSFPQTYPSAMSFVLRLNNSSHRRAAGPPSTRS